MPQNTFEDNWDKCFKRDKCFKHTQQEITELNADGNWGRGENGEEIDLEYESDNPLERPWIPKMF